MPTHSRVAEAREVLGDRIGLATFSPTAVALGRDLTNIEHAVESGFISPSDDGKKELATLRASLKTLMKSVEKKADDPAQFTKAVRKELSDVKAIRAKLKQWTLRRWKNFWRVKPAPRW